MAKAAANGPDEAHAPAPAEPLTCGIVMPISAIDDCPAAHWLDVRKIVEEAADKAGFRARLVSAAEYAGVILKEIIHNLYHDPIVVCDVSGRNPNVMFELGLRLAFDKPTILIKDDITTYAFDTSPIEHLEYPRGLGYWTMVDFKEKLSEKIRATHKQATTDKNYTTFLKHFGEFKIAAVETTEVSGQEFIIQEMNEIKTMLRDFAFKIRAVETIDSARSLPVIPSNAIRIHVDGLNRDQIAAISKGLSNLKVPYASTSSKKGGGISIRVWGGNTDMSIETVKRMVAELVPDATVSVYLRDQVE